MKLEADADTDRLLHIVETVWGVNLDPPSRVHFSVGARSADGERYEIALDVDFDSESDH